MVYECIYSKVVGGLDGPLLLPLLFPLLSRLVIRGFSPRRLRSAEGSLTSNLLFQYFEPSSCPRLVPCI